MLVSCVPHLYWCFYKQGILLCLWSDCYLCLWKLFVSMYWFCISIFLLNFCIVCCNFLSDSPEFLREAIVSSAKRFYIRVKAKTSGNGIWEMSIAHTTSQVPERECWEKICRKQYLWRKSRYLLRHEVVGVVSSGRDWDYERVSLILNGHSKGPGIN